VYPAKESGRDNISVMQGGSGKGGVVPGRRGAAAESNRRLLSEMTAESRLQVGTNGVEVYL
jgi:hypothetical protein